MDASQHALSTAASDITRTLLGFIASDACTDAQFDELALRLFAYQYANNEPYRRFYLAHQREIETAVLKVYRWILSPTLPRLALLVATVGLSRAAVGAV